MSVNFLTLITALKNCFLAIFLAILNVSQESKAAFAMGYSVTHPIRDDRLDESNRLNPGKSAPLAISSSVISNY
ncbi:hypothetical protein [Pseudomonas fluorescens]|uniref:hypothetical protein n=1 Tax=Pseudomonas fluorescens TaxID=294 RepID=UPI0012408A86|nr:hypothetical protein [Pseudomonas fluorescens]